MWKSVVVGLALAVAFGGQSWSRSAEEKAHIAAIVATIEPPILSSHRLVVEDQRPDKDRKGYVLSGFIFNCENGVWNIGDQQLGDRVTRLERDLLAAFGDVIQGQHLIVRKYAIYLNGRAALESAATSGTGLVGSMMGPGPTLKAKCERSRMTGGWFDTSEVTNNFSPIVIEMEVAFRGEDFTVRSVYSPEVETWMEFDNHALKPVMVASVQHAIAKADAALVADINKRGERPSG